MGRRGQDPFVANFLLRQYALTGLTKDHLEGLATNDEANVPELFSFCLQPPLKTELPLEVQSAPLVAYELLEKRAKALGDRIAHLLVGGGLKPSGLNFGAGGCYSLTFEGEQVKMVKHCSGAEVDLSATPHIVITRSFELFDNHMDGLARCVLGFTTHHLCNFFSKDTAFAQHIIRDRKAEQLVDMAKDLIQAEQAREVAVAEASAIDTSILAKPTAQRKKDIIARATSAAEQKKVERGKRKIKMT